MTDTTTYEWFHKDRKLFFLKEDGKITHCYQLARELCCEVDKNQWWRIDPIPEMDDLIPVPRDSEIEYQLHSLDDEDHPIAGVFMKNIRERHPRRHQWRELLVMDHIPERWLIDPWTVPDDRDFASASFLYADMMHHFQKIRRD